MAKRQQQTQQTDSSSRTTLIVLIVGGLLVAGLVAWALTRSVEPQMPPTMAGPEATATPSSATAASTATSMTPTTTAPVNVTQSPLPSDESWFNEDAHRKVPRIAVEDLRAQVNRGAVTVIDVRDRGSYETAHIPGALHIPLNQIQSQLDLVPKGKPIVTYCT